MTVKALPPPSVETVLKRVTEKKPVNKAGLINPQFIELQPLNVIEIHFGSTFDLVYIVIQRSELSELGLYSPMSKVIIKFFPSSFNIIELNRELKVGKIIAWYSTIEDYVNKRNKIPIHYGGVNSGTSNDGKV